MWDRWQTQGMFILFQPTLNHLDLEFVVGLIVHADHSVETNIGKSVFVHITQEVGYSQRGTARMELQQNWPKFCIQRDKDS